MTPYELQIEVLRGYMRFYSLRTWLGYIFTLQFTKQLLFHWWGMAIIRNWRKDERNKAFIKALKRMWPRPTPRGTRAPGARRLSAPRRSARRDGSARRAAAVVRPSAGC